MRVLAFGLWITALTSCMALDPGSMVEKLGLSECVHECNNQMLLCTDGARECMHQCDINYDEAIQDQCERQCVLEGQKCLEVSLRCAEACLKAAEESLD